MKPCYRQEGLTMVSAQSGAGLQGSSSPKKWRVFRAAFPRRVFGNADHSGADRTSDQAGAAQESAAGLKPAGYWTVSRVVSVKQRWRGRALLAAPPPGRELRSGRDHLTRLSRSAPRPSLAQ